MEAKDWNMNMYFLLVAILRCGKAKRNTARDINCHLMFLTKETPEEKEEELRRLFFVAATRAEKYLYISFPSFTNDGKALEAHVLLQKWRRII